MTFRTEFTDVADMEVQDTFLFAFWCLEHGEREQVAGRDLPTCVVVGFLEEIPTHHASRKAMPRWFTRQEVLAMRETFTCHDSGDFQSLLALWDENKPSGWAARSGPNAFGSTGETSRSPTNRRGTRPCKRPALHNEY